jgi:antigen flippase
VREIAEAVGSGDNTRVARTIYSLRRIAFYSGALGAVLVVCLARPISQFTFKSTALTTSVALMGLAAFFGDISAAQAALLRGLRRIADIARMNILGAVYGTLFSIPIVWAWGEKGIPPALICVGFMSFATSWWYARKIEVERINLSWRETFNHASEMVRLGVVFMASFFSMQAANFLTRVIVARQLGSEAGGYYQAALAIGSQYIGFILTAMQMDFYPRLTAVASNHDECNRLVNEQSEVSLLMAGPTLIATLTLAPFILVVLAQKDFVPAAPILRWICLGMMMKVLTWPMGFIILAKGARKIFFWSEVLGNALLIGITWFSVKYFGLLGGGIAFFVQFAIYFFVVYAIVNRLTGFRWSGATLKLAAIYLPLVALAFVAANFLNPLQTLFLGTVLCVPAGLYSVKTLLQLLPFDRLPGAVKKVFRLLRLAPSTPLPP